MNDTNGTGRIGQSGIGRRGLLKGMGLAVAGATLARPAISTSWAQSATPSASAAKAEGPLILWHADQEGQTLDFLKKFSEATGLEVRQQHILPGVALPKLIAEVKAGASDVDVFAGSDAVLEDLRRRDYLMEYASPELSAYGPAFRSTPPGFWTAYYTILNPMMYSPKHLAAENAPKTWEDLLDRAFANQLGVQTAAAGTQYLWWYLLQPVLPASFWTDFAKQRPRAYESSTQMVKSIISGELKIGAKVSDFQYIQASRRGDSVEAVFPAAGVPTGSQVAGIVKTTKRPNSAKIFMDYLLSRDGQVAWNTAFGSHSPRADVKIPGVRPLSDFKLLTVTDFDDYASPKRRAEFSAQWNKITGF